MARWPCMTDRRAFGFTLLEVLIALAVIAIALLALSRTALLQVHDFDGLRERTLAAWLASNVLTETRLGTGLPALGRSDGRVEFGDRRWRWTREVLLTPSEGIRGVEISVYVDGARLPAARLRGFAGTPP